MHLVHTAMQWRVTTVRGSTTGFCTLITIEMRGTPVWANTAEKAATCIDEAEPSPHTGRFRWAAAFLKQLPLSFVKQRAATTHVSDSPVDPTTHKDNQRY